MLYYMQRDTSINFGIYFSVCAANLAKNHHTLLCDSISYALGLYLQFRLLSFLLIQYFCENYANNSTYYT